MPNTALPTNITPGVTATFEADVESAWTEINELSRDTGLRDITSMLINGWTASTVRIRRTRNRTYWEFFNLNGSAATSTTVIDMSTLTGFRPSASVESEAWRTSTGAFTGYVRVSTTAVTVPIGYITPASTIRGFDHRCTAPWPTTLPGTPVAE